MNTSEQIIDLLNDLRCRKETIEKLRIKLNELNLKKYSNIKKCNSFEKSIAAYEEGLRELPKNEHIINSLTSVAESLRSYDDELILLNNEINIISRKIKSEQLHIKSINAQVKLLKKTDRKSAVPIVSDHAVLRYLERVEGIDLEEIRKKILTEKTIKFINTLSSGNFPLDGNRNYVIRVKDKIVVTIVKNKRFKD